MPRRKKDNLYGIIALLGIAVYLFPLIILAVVLYYLYKWQKGKVNKYGDYASFYKNELRSKLKIAFLALPFGLTPY